MKKKNIKKAVTDRSKGNKGLNGEPSFNQLTLLINNSGLKLKKRLKGYLEDTIKN